jgi:sugar lactone lactonase YvrE
MSRRILVVLAMVAAAPAFAAQPQFWNIEGARDFLEGDLEAISVDSEGRLRVAPASRNLVDTEAPYVWALALDDQGRLYAGTGNDGKVFRADDGEATVFFDAPELEVHALAFGPRGRLYVGTSPDGKVYEVESNGTWRPFFDPEEKYIWALAADGKGNLLVATGAEGRIYRVDAKGEAKPILSSPETHITALLADAGGNVYAGSAPGGVVYRIDEGGKVFVLHDSGYREVKSLVLGAEDALYVAAIDGKPRDERGPEATFTLPTVSTGEITVSETVTVVAPPAVQTPAPLAPGPRPQEQRPSGPVKGAVLRIARSGEVETLWTSTEETPFSMAPEWQGVLVGAGTQGRLYRIQDDRTWTMLSAFPAEQATALLRSEGRVVIATSNPGRLYVLDPTLAARGSFTSKVRDTDTVSAWGRLRWEGRAPEGTSIELFTRSGNTAVPDSTWTDWSRPYTHQQGQAITSENARFLQVRAVLVAKGAETPLLDSVSSAYLQRNLRPQVQVVNVHSPGEAFQKPLSLNPEGEILGLDSPPPAEARPSAASRPPLPPATAFSRRLFQKGLQTFTWKADDPNGDTLSYDVLYRAAGETRFRPLRKGLTEPVLAWDTSTVPNGRYVVRVVASDSPSNPESLALTGEKDSVPFDVDNTPPMVTAEVVSSSALRVRAVARDDSSMVRRAEYSVDGGPWKEVHPLDGINDALEETYEIPLSGLPSPGPHVVVVRATDLLGNMSTSRVEVP